MKEAQKKLEEKGSGSPTTPTTLTRETCAAKRFGTKVTGSHRLDGDLWSEGRGQCRVGPTEVCGGWVEVGKVDREGHRRVPYRRWGSSKSWSHYRCEG